MDCLKISEVAARLRVSPRTVYRLVWDGELAAYQVRGALRVTEGALAAYLEANVVRVERKRPQPRPRTAPPRSQARKAFSGKFKFFPPSGTA
jgi:excisionase family DNA binding protein